MIPAWLLEILRGFEARDDTASVEYDNTLNNQCNLTAMLMPMDGA